MPIHRVFSDLGYQIDKEELLASPKYHGYFKFAFVRNPWDRLVSCYRDKILGEGLGLRAYRRGPMVPKGLTFAGFVDAVCEIPDHKANPHFRSQFSMLSDDGGSLLPDFVGRFENLGEDFAWVGEGIGVPDLTLPHLLRTSGGSPYRAAYDARTRSLTEERYRRDAEVFGYSF